MPVSAAAAQAFARKRAAPPLTATRGSVLDEAVPYAPVPLLLPDMLRRIIRLEIKAGSLHRDCLIVFEANISHLHDYQAGRLTVSLETLCDDTGMSKSHLCACLAALEAAGYLTRWQRYKLVPAPAGWRGRTRKQQMTTAYLWHLPEPDDETAQEAEAGWTEIVTVDSSGHCEFSGRTLSPVMPITVLSDGLAPGAELSTTARKWLQGIKGSG